MDVASFLARLQARRDYQGQIAAVRVLEARPAQYKSPAGALPGALLDLMHAERIAQLYAHQAEAFDAVRAGQHVVICTGTASGKSLCFHLPILAGLLEDGDARALCLFPAKALAYDQLANLERMVTAGGLAERARPACYDGDTPTHKRPGIRRNANILLSNPDMLHTGILPYHAKWAGFFAQLRFIVLDEIHSYRGIFGSHVAGVIRRLQRVCRHYGANPQFICCSATLGNPRELAERLIAAPVRRIEADGSPRGRRWFVLWNPPWVEPDGQVGKRGEHLRIEERTAVARPDPLPAGMARSAPVGSGPRGRSGSAGGADGGSAEGWAEGGPGGLRISRRSANVEAQELMQALLEEGAGTIAFCKARIVAELLYKYLTDALRRRRPDLARAVKPYRGGYLPSERRAIERALFTGELRGVCSTNALELGIDVGALDAAVLVGFPGTLCSLWQQAGRAGRRQDESVAFLVAYDDPVDQYLMRNAEFVFGRPLEQAVVDPCNPHILAAQLACAARELPLASADLAEFGESAGAVAELLVENETLRHTAGAYYYAQPDMPQHRTSLRTISAATFSIVDVTEGDGSGLQPRPARVIGQVDAISAPELVYPEAIYLHQGESYIVRQLDLAARLARVERCEADYYTQPVLADECRLVAEHLRGACLGGRRCFGDVTVRWQTVAFRKFKFHGMELIGQTALDLPAQEVDTTGCWLQPPPAALEAVRGAGHKSSAALSGARNLLTVVLPTLAMCDRYDVGGVLNPIVEEPAPPSEPAPPARNAGRPDRAFGAAPAYVTAHGPELAGTGAARLAGTIVLYDRYEGGVGYARHGYERAEELLRLAVDLARGCPCSHGCPGCVGPPNLRVAIHHDPDVGFGYRIPEKAATVALLEAWLNSA